MIDLASESLLTLEQAGERLQISKSTLYRWITSGVKGVRLEAVRVGGRWRTSEEAIQRFSEGLTPEQENNSPQPVRRTSAQRQRAIELAEQQLDEWFNPHRCESCRAAIVAPKGSIPKGERLWCPNCIVKRKSATIGRRIRAFRWAALLSQSALSGRTGISVDSIRAYESDEKIPNADHLDKLLKVLGSDLVAGIEIP